MTKNWKQWCCQFFLIHYQCRFNNQISYKKANFEKLYFFDFSMQNWHTFMRKADIGLQGFLPRYKKAYSNSQKKNKMLFIRPISIKTGSFVPDNLHSTTQLLFVINLRGFVFLTQIYVSVVGCTLSPSYLLLISSDFHYNFHSISLHAPCQVKL